MVAVYPNLVQLCRRWAVVFVAAGLIISGASAAEAESGADLAVGLHAVGSPVTFLAGANYTMSITNNGPEPLVSATVVVSLDPQVSYPAGPANCPLDTHAHTLTCSFGALPAGATATMSTFVYFSIRKDRATLEATASRTTSDPADLNSGNDVASTTCWYERPAEGSTWPPPMICAP